MFYVALILLSGSVYMLVVGEVAYSAEMSQKPAPRWLYWWPLWLVTVFPVRVVKAIWRFIMHVLDEIWKEIVT